MILDSQSETDIEVGVPRVMMKNSFNSVLTATSADICWEHPRQIEQVSWTTENHGDTIEGME